MFILNGIEQLEAGIIKAKKIRTQVKFIKFGVYSVRGTQGNFYQVECKKVDNQKIVECNCKGGLANLVCFHAVSALSLHVAIARQRQTA
jgi:hypothetical protein